MEYRKVGKAAGTFGVKGEMKVISHTDFPEQRFAKGKALYILHNGSYETVHVRTYRVMKNRVYLSFEEIPDLTAAEPYKSDVLFVDRNDLPELKEDEYYAEDILGMKVYVNDKYLGEVTDMDFLPAHPVIRVGKGEQSVLIPFVGAFILSVDKEERIIRIDPKEGIV
ncbi:MAG: 16S rRNA processing protein RimM [Erysipelotrichales bacterium]|nr:16S rRNA processing protein RimM [Erysipelotrichales bacterium]MBQ2478909.1 16S rRNA processing protein RimM [Erysipelotrichales bacterium]